MKWLDLHVRNIGVALPTLDNHSIDKILSYFGNPECLMVLPREQPSHPQSLPAYLVPPISVLEYLTHEDPTLHEAPLRVEIMDLGNGQYSNCMSVTSIRLISMI